MRGLIVKDLLYMKTTWKNLVVMFIGSLLISIAIGNYLLAISVIPVMLLASGISTFQTDEFYNTESYTLAMPLSRIKIVTCKYLFTLIMMLISTIIGLIIYELIIVIGHVDAAGINVDMLKQLIMLELASVIVNSIFYPVIYKYGCEKSRFVLMSIVMLLLGVGSIFSVYINVINVQKIDFTKYINFIQEHGLNVLFVAVIIITIISYGLSILFYRHKDY